jgi:hypothetical protein
MRAVFGFLRLPTLLALLSPYADPDSPEALRFGLWATFHVLAAIALLQALFLACVLPPSVVPNATAVEEDERSLKAAMWEAGGKLVVGFKLAARDGNIALGFASSFAVHHGADFHVLARARMLTIQMNRHRVELRRPSPTRFCRCSSRG